MSDIPGITFNWISTIDDFEKLTMRLREEAIRLYDELGKETDVTFTKVGQKLADFELRFTTECDMIGLYQNVHPDKDWREASMVADKFISELKIDLSMRKDVFDQFVSIQKEESTSLSVQAKRYVDEKVKEGRHNGLHLDEDVRKQVEAITKELAVLAIDFERNLCEEHEELEFTEDELEGCTEEFISSLEKAAADATKKKVTLKYPHYFPIMRMAIRPDTRRLMETAFNSRCKEANGLLLMRMIALRGKMAGLLSYDSHADYVLSQRMAKDAKTVWEFLQDLRKRLSSVKDEEMKLLVDHKRRICEERGFEFNGRVDAWDYRYLMDKVEVERFSVDHERLREFFPLGVVTAGMFGIYEKLLGLQFTRKVVSGLWHEDVELYEVVDAREKGCLMGYFLMDLHPRDGKYGHAKVKLIQVGGCINSDEEKRQVAAVVMIANFTRPLEAGSQALLTHDEVITYFHEFGHIMHVLCGKNKFGMQTSYYVERDFVECPSQMLENWCWETEPLRMMSGHHKTGEPIGDDLMANLVRSRVANAGLLNMRQLCLGAFDQVIHTQPTEDPVSVYKRITEEYLGIPVTDGTNMPATFTHMAGGYDAQYYGYLWSEVFAADMFVSRFKAEGLFNADTGASYRQLILQPAATKDASDMLRDFLGRPPNQEAFLTLIGLKSSVDEAQRGDK